jgi:cytosine/adenosine deaminase-related metal-dependent hydrolase
MILRGVEIVGQGGGRQEIAIAGSTIARVSPCAPRDAPADRGELALDFEEAIAFPGLTNSHDHLEFNLHPSLGHARYADYREWGNDIHRRDAAVIASLQRVPKAVRLRWGALKNLLCGVTTVAHHGARGDDLRPLPVRAAPGTAIHSVGAAPRWRLRLNAPFGQAPWVVHVGEGTSAGAHREIDALLRWNLLRKPLVGVHAIAMRPAQAPRFRAVVWCPVSNEFLYGATADVSALKRSTTILFGTDSTLTADWNVWNHLRRARALGPLDDRELFAALTRAAAVVWGRPDDGRLAAGTTADVVIARRKAQDPWDAFFAVDPEDILLVLRDGAPILCDASVEGVRIDGPWSSLRLGAATKRVAEDVPDLLARLRRYAAAPNLPIAVAPGALVVESAHRMGPR